MCLTFPTSIYKDMIKIKNLELLAELDTTNREIYLFIGTNSIEMQVKHYYIPIGSKERVVECCLTYPANRFNQIDMKDALKWADNQINELIAIKNN